MNKKKKKVGNLEKNQHYTLTVEDLGTKGEGIGKVDGFTLFVPGALPGDHIEARIILLKKNYGVGKLIQVLVPSPYRVSPRCPHSGPCGGCQIQHMDYRHQLTFKSKKVADSLQRIGKLQPEELRPIIGMDTPFHYRNKAQFAIGEGKDHSPLVGLYTIKSHHIINTTQCDIQHPLVLNYLNRFRDYLTEVTPELYNEHTHEGLIRHLVIRVAFTTGHAMVCVVINGDDIPQPGRLIACLQDENLMSLALNTNTAPGDTIMGDQTRILQGSDHIEETIQGRRFAISPRSFFQINPVQTEFLATTVKAFAGCDGTQTVWDAYCGTGMFALLMADQAKTVIGVESLEEAVINARQNAQLNGLTHVSFITGEAETVFPRLVSEHQRADVMILDPPRKGCDTSLLDTIAATLPARVIYVSCNPDTLARDLAYLIPSGYTLKTVQPIDLFPHTVHVESVSLLVKH